MTFRAIKEGGMIMTKEIEEKLSRIRKLMEEERLDAVLLTLTPNFSGLQEEKVDLWTKEQWMRL